MPKFLCGPNLQPMTDVYTSNLSMQGRIAALRAIGFTSHFSRAPPPFPPPHLPFPLTFLFPSLPFPSFPLEVGPLNAARRFGGAL